jgi:O-acetyl-ADP-ribose deacetylase (regulator of RNase III)
MRVTAARGDITRERVDAVVNAANSSLYGGGGVDGAIHRAAGPSLLEECRQVRQGRWPDGLPTGEAVVTPAGRMAARHVIHTVGPKRWEYADGGADLLARCHESCLSLADQLGLTSIAFPAISCGVYGWQPVDAAPIAVEAVRAFARAHPGSPVQEVRFVLFGDDALAAFRAAVVAGAGS